MQHAFLTCTLSAIPFLLFSQIKLMLVKIYMFCTIGVKSNRSALGEITNKDAKPFGKWIIFFNFIVFSLITLFSLTSGLLTGCLGGWRVKLTPPPPFLFVKQIYNIWKAFGLYFNKLKKKLTNFIQIFIAKSNVQKYLQNV